MDLSAILDALLTLIWTYRAPGVSFVAGLLTVVSRFVHIFLKLLSECDWLEKPGSAELRRREIKAASQIHHFRSESGAGAQHSDDECARVDFGDCTSSAMDYHATARECNVSG